MTQVVAEDLDTLADAGASVVHCPESNLKLGAGVCPLPALLGRGVRVALGTDGAASNNDLDVLGEARTAGLLASGVTGAPGSLIAADLLRMATLEGARVLGLGEVTGSLVPGKWADLCCIDLRTPGSWPVSDVAGRRGLLRLVAPGHGHVGRGTAAARGRHARSTSTKRRPCSIGRTPGDVESIPRQPGGRVRMTEYRQRRSGGDRPVRGGSQPLVGPRRARCARCTT